MTSRTSYTSQQQQQQQQQHVHSQPTSATSLNTSVSSEEDLSPHLPSSTPALTDMTESQIQSEAEMWKTIGNRHMTHSDYIKAYAAYSTALSLSPLGPTSHVFLSNRSAALLSLKRYPAAAMDAKRAITLAPSFGKAHARLGQSCYFQKQYKEAVDAYQTARMYEPENKVTAVYLEKAKKKLGRELERMDRRKRREVKAAKHDEEYTSREHTSREHGTNNMGNGSSNSGSNSGSSSREINRTLGVTAPPDPSGDYQSTHSTTQYISPNNSITNNSNNNSNNNYIDNDAISVDSSINTGMDAMSIIDDSESKGPLFRSKAVLGATYTTTTNGNYDGNAPTGELMELQKSKALMERIQAVVEENYDEPNSNTKGTPGKHKSTSSSSSSRNIPKEIGTNTNVSSSTNSDIRELAQSITNDLNTSAKQMAMRISSKPPVQVITSPSDEEKSHQDSALNNDKNYNNTKEEEEDDDDDDEEEDPDFEEAIRLQEKATTHLSQKQYSHAVETYSAALFLVPDDINLTPQLFVGRAHALNGLLRHASAQNDAVMALNKQADYAEAHIVLGRSFFYLREYGNAIQSFERAKECLEYGYGIDHGIDGLTALDQLYLEKAKDAVNETLEKGKGFDAAAPGDTVGSSVNGGGGGGDNEDDNRSLAFSILSKSSKPVPKLQPPPSVASRQEMKKSTTNVPPLPKEWADKIPYSPTSLRVGTERNVIFLSDSLGIKINRGPDGIVRILHITPITPGCAIVRKGQLHAGDVVREAAGVDLRRPITNVMWSDTVALLRIAPRPLTMIVAVELSELPPVIREEFNKAKNDAGQN